jgi:hypothetical protein
MLLVQGLLVGCSGDDSAQDLGVEDGGHSDLAVPDLTSSVDLTQAPDLMPACDADAGVPETLACSGLYADWNAKTPAAGVQAFAPGYALWSDGADKSRFIQIPTGQKIDVTATNDWVFPVGTKLWKEFRLKIGSADKRIETRMWWKRGVGDWVPVVYRWSDDESTTTRLSTGETVAGTSMYEIPAESRCVQCHKMGTGHTEAPLGFSAVLLADPAATGLTYAQLLALNLTSSSGATVPAASLQIPGTATERAALGYLHVNCGTMCHRPSGGAPFRLDLDVSSGSAPADVQSTAAFSAINQAANHVLQNPPIVGANYYRFRPTDTQRSMIRLRMDVRDAVAGGNGVDQMPPLVSHVKDTVGLAAIDAWINAMTGGVYPAPSPP